MPLGLLARERRERQSLLAAGRTTIKKSNQIKDMQSRTEDCVSVLTLLAIGVCVNRPGLAGKRALDATEDE